MVALSKKGRKILSKKVGVHNKHENERYCPFYIRYQREDKEDLESPYYLLDWNLMHTHPLDTRLGNNVRPNINDDECI